MGRLFSLVDDFKAWAQPVGGLGKGSGALQGAMSCWPELGELEVPWETRDLPLTSLPSDHHHCAVG